MLRKPHFCALIRLRKLKLTVSIKPGSMSAKHLWSVYGKSLSHSSVKVGPLQPGRHGARETVSRPRSWEDIWILYKQFYMDEFGYRKRNSLGNSAISWLNCATAQILSKHLSSDFWLEDNLSFCLLLFHLKMPVPQREPITGFSILNL